MKYRTLLNRKLEVVENDLTVLRTIVQRQEPVKRYLEILTQTQEDLEEVKNLISVEPVTSNEVVD